MSYYYVKYKEAGKDFYRLTDNYRCIKAALESYILLCKIHGEINVGMVKSVQVEINYKAYALEGDSHTAAEYIGIKFGDEEEE